MTDDDEEKLSPFFLPHLPVICPVRSLVVGQYRFLQPTETKEWKVIRHHQATATESPAPALAETGSDAGGDDPSTAAAKPHFRGSRLRSLSKKPVYG